MIFMNKISTIIISSFFIVFASSGFLYADEKNAYEQIAGKHIENMMNLTMVARNYIKDHFEDHKMIDQCRGSFANEGENEFAVVLYDQEHQQVQYTVILVKDEKVYKTETIYRNKVDPKHSLWEEVQCKSAMEVKRFNKNIEGMTGVQGHIDSKTQFDTICIPGNDYQGFHCYEFDQKQGKFIYVGGWTT